MANLDVKGEKCMNDSFEQFYEFFKAHNDDLSLRANGNHVYTKSYFAKADVMYRTAKKGTKTFSNVSVGFGFNNPKECAELEIYEDVDSIKYYSGFNTKFQNFSYDSGSKILIIKGVDSASKGIGDYIVEVYNVRRHSQ